LALNVRGIVLEDGSDPGLAHRTTLLIINAFLVRLSRPQRPALASHGRP